MVRHRDDVDMKITTWNCKGAFARKHCSIAALTSDILVIPESEELQYVNNLLGTPSVNSFHWIGENRQKGLGVVSYGDYSLAIHPAYDSKLRYILPLQVDGPLSFLLLAVWTLPDPEDGVYARALFRALTTYDHLLREQPAIIAGDFNQSVCLDKPGRPLNFAEWMTCAEQFGLRSSYHSQRACAHGSESEPTFFMHHSSAKGHHIDFVFASPSLLDALDDVLVGSHSNWAKLSDHMPLQCTFNCGERKV